MPHFCVRGAYRRSLNTGPRLTCASARHPPWRWSMKMTEHNRATLGSRASVTLADTIERAGPLVEQGSAFMQLEGERLHGWKGDDSVNASRARRESFDVVVVGAGQAGLSAGYYLSRIGLNFV